MSGTIDELRYPRLNRRIEAVIIDSIVLSAAFFGTIMLLAGSETNSGLKLVLVVLLIFILEPGLVSFAGGTIGHRLRGLKVQDQKLGKNLNLLRATVRFFLKGLLGLPSFVFVLTTKKHQALHDFVSRSVVVIRDPEQVPEHEALPERTVEVSDFSYPSKKRRILTIILYVFVGAIILAIIEESICALSYGENCGAFENGVLGIVWWIVVAFSIVLGWRGRLWGSRRRRRSS